MSKKYALLVGVDHYLNGTEPNEFRKSAKGDTVTLRNLQGCVQDVESIRDILQYQYRFDEVVTLLSPTPMSGYGSIGLKSRPTFRNILDHFVSITNKAQEGDFFFFHFSGHGANIDRVSNSPEGRLTDPSLMTMDFCCQRPAVRGWQLNQWLEKMNQKGIQIAVCLDSCYSGGAWRGDGNESRNHVGYRSPNNWPSVPSLDVDEEATSGDYKAPAVPATRASEVEISWSLNPKAFTLMTACRADQKAAEVSFGGKIGGAFTFQLLAYLKDAQYHVSYRMIQDHIIANLSNQQPTVYGRDRYLFLGNTEPFFVTPLNVTIEGTKAVISAGRAHGVYEKAEFELLPSLSALVLTIDHVEEFQSSAEMSAEVKKGLLSHVAKKAVPSRWSLGLNTTINILLATNFTAEFQNSLHKALGKQLTNQISVTRKHDTLQKDGQITAFKLHDSGTSGIEILGPKAAAGYKSSEYSVKLSGFKHKTLADQAVEAASCIAHMARLSLTLGLQPSMAAESNPFKVTLVPEDGSLGQGPYPPGTKLIYTFENLDPQNTLYFSLINIRPEFDVQQIYPPHDGVHAVGKRDYRKLGVTIKKNREQPNPEEQIYTTNNEELYRTLVSREEQISWKGLELPRICDASKWKVQKQLRGDDEACVQEIKSDKWWMDDQRVIVTHRENTAKAASNPKEPPEIKTEKLVEGEIQEILTSDGEDTFRPCTQMFLPEDLEKSAVQAALKENPQNMIHSPEVCVPPARGTGTIEPGTKRLDQDGRKGGESPAESSSMGLSVRKMWANGRTLRVRFMSDPGSHIESMVKRYANVWFHYANIWFDFDRSAKAEIRVAFMPGQSWSYVGTDALLVEPGEPTMNFGWLSNDTTDEEFNRTVTHEFGHAIGCLHRHPESNAEIQRNRPVVYEGYASEGYLTRKIGPNTLIRQKATSVMASPFHPACIMENPIPKDYATRDSPIDWNSQLPPTDIDFIQKMYPKAAAGQSSVADAAGSSRIGVFNTLCNKCNENTTNHETMVRFSYSSLPGFATGLNFLDFGTPGNIQIKSIVKALLPTQARFELEFEDGDAQQASGISWFAFPSEDTDLQTGSHIATSSDVEQTIVFKHRYSSPPKVLVFFTAIDIKKLADCHIETLVSSVSTDRFTFKMKSNIRVSQVKVSWIALPPNKPGIAAGTFDTRETQSSGGLWPANKQGKVQFSPTLAKSPNLFLALSMLDINRNGPTRLRLSGSNISASGMTWHVDSWGGATVNSAAASYIAIST